MFDSGSVGLDALFRQSTIRDPGGILAYCRARLAAFKVPRYYAYTDSFPRTVSNKIEKRSLIADVSDLRVNAWDAEATAPGGGKNA